MKVNICGISHEIVEELTMKAIETQSEFIFQTIQPYCENITEQRISKRQLEEALLLYFNKKKLIKEWLSSFNTDSVPICFNKIQELKRECEKE